MLTILSQTSQPAGFRNWTPQDWTLFLGALGTFIGVVGKLFLDGRAQKRDTQKLASITATTAMAQNQSPGPQVPQAGIDAATKIAGPMPVHQPVDLPSAETIAANAETQMMNAIDPKLEQT